MKQVFGLFMLCVLLGSAALAQAAEFPDFTRLAKDSSSAVVNISTERNGNAGGPEAFFGGMLRDMPPNIDKFFEQFGKNFAMPQQQRKQRSLGSGFLISADGYIVTNNHVVEGADIIRVNLQGATGKNDSIEAKLVGADAETDIALLKVTVKKDLPFLKFGDSDALQVGEWLLAIGNPFWLDHTVTAGILSAKGRNIQSGAFDNFLQTDASINPGNSGGPLLNMKGEVVGINTAIIASGQGIGFAIPSAMAKDITDQIKNGKKVSRGWLGVTIGDLDENGAKALGLSQKSGALIGDVIAGEPADKAGMQAGDIVLSVQGKTVEDSAALLRAIAALSPGSKAQLVVWRDGARKEINVTLGERNATAQGKGAEQEKGHVDSPLGIGVRPLSREERQQLNIDKNKGLLIVKVERGKPAAEAELLEGDIILTANMKPVNSPEALAAIVKNEGQKRGALMLQVMRHGETGFKTIMLGK